MAAALRTRVQPGGSAARPTDYRDVSSRSFAFGLERVRELRVHTEDRAKEAFAASLGERGRGADRLTAAELELAAAHEAGRQATVADAGELVRRQAWLQRLERSKTDAALALLALDAELAAQRHRLQDASRAREVLDRLKERRHAEHRAEAARVEGLALDEMALQAHARRAL
jgi:flagellar protein FliJ